MQKKLIIKELKFQKIVNSITFLFLFLFLLAVSVFYFNVFFMEITTNSFKITLIFTFLFLLSGAIFYFFLRWLEITRLSEFKFSKIILNTNKTPNQILKPNDLGWWKNYVFDETKGVMKEISGNNAFKILSDNKKKTIETRFSQNKVLEKPIESVLKECVLAGFFPF